MNYKAIFLKFLNSSLPQGELLEPIKYIMLQNGKLIRPQLVMSWCHALGGRVEDSLPLALAVECIHTMSLIQDDLPCMDNEIFRRNNPCLHRKYGEALALLTSDKLLSFSFLIIAKSGLSEKQKIQAISILSEASCNMADGQSLEFMETDFSEEKYLQSIYGKTAALIEASCGLGAIVAGANSDIAMNYGKKLGMLYQILDDRRDEDGITQLVAPEKIDEYIQLYCDDLTFISNQIDNSLLKKITEAVCNEAFSDHS